jgi:peptidoglycan/xylan/chitin deacetylase (PgdA/CDA1 family)
VTFRLAGRLRGAAASLRAQHVPRVAVLLYHRVAESPCDPWRLCVTPRHFAEHCEVLARARLAWPLTGLLPALTEGRLPRRAAVVTFDDGYADNLEHARPRLARHDVPATVFVVGGAVGASREFWWDELELALLGNRPLPPTLVLEVAGVVRRWELGPDGASAPVSPAVTWAWKPWEDAHPTARHALYRELYDLLFPLATAERRAVLDALLAWSGGTPAARPSHRTLTESELAELAGDKLIEIGCHTMNHPPLATLPPAAQRAEIAEAKSRLEAIVGRPVQGFAYPYGRRCDYGPETVDLVRGLAFAGGCSNFPGLVERRTNRFELPRLQVRNWDGDEFARRLDAWFAGNIG